MKKKLTRQELYELVWAESMLSLSKKFDISDVGLRKICKKLSIPVPKLGFWQKVRAGKKVSKPELPPSDSADEVSLVEVERLTNKKVYPWTQRQLEIESDLNLNLIVPERLSRPDELIVAARRALGDAENKSWKFSGMRESRRGTLDIVVQPKLIRRALIFMDSLIKLLRSRGHDIEVQYDDTYAIIKEERIKIQIKERSRIVKHPDGHWPSREFLPTGVLVFKSNGYYGTEWVDGKRRLEDQLSHILARMETKVDLLHEIWRQNRIREEEENRRIQRIKEEEDRKEKELQNFKTLLNQSRRWRQVKVLREFLADAEVRAISNNKLSEKFATWLEWAIKKADWYDPHIEAEDSLLMEVDRENLVRAKKAMESFD